MAPPTETTKMNSNFPPAKDRAAAKQLLGFLEPNRGDDTVMRLINSNDAIF